MVEDEGLFGSWWHSEDGNAHTFVITDDLHTVDALSPKGVLVAPRFDEHPAAQLCREAVADGKATLNHALPIDRSCDVGRDSRDTRAGVAGDA
ncbi:hypothetical protein [Burkholderia sp. BCC1047]|uniref:hypothetical protein n=1 Tax=Burkholderia sp. BCC1047 TaxID=2676299 RepID=UPI001588E2B0|nr:hypothetical protein [Burkholderia sp. BCC1047]